MASLGALPTEIRQKIFLLALYAHGTCPEDAVRLRMRSPERIGDHPIKPYPLEPFPVTPHAIRVGHRLLGALKLLNKQCHAEALEVSQRWMDLAIIGFLDELDDIRHRLHPLLLYEHRAWSLCKSKNRADVFRYYRIRKMQIPAYFEYREKIFRAEGEVASYWSLDGFSDFMRLCLEMPKVDSEATDEASPRRSMGRLQRLQVVHFGPFDQSRLNEEDYIYAEDESAEFPACEGQEIHVNRSEGYFRERWKVSDLPLGTLYDLKERAGKCKIKWEEAGKLPSFDFSSELTDWWRPHRT